jgi:integrase
MARRRSLLSSRTSRADLPASDAPEWEIIAPGVRLGYRRGRGTTGRGGTWLAATRGADGSRVQSRLGRADDVTTTADGALTHEQAKDAARAWARSLKTGGPVSRQLTVDDVLNKYLSMKESEGARSDVRSAFNAHISPILGKIRVADLTTERLRNWRDAISRQPKRFRTGKSSTVNRIVVIESTDEEGMRRRRDSTNRILTVLKAGLNWAYHQRLVTDDTAWRLLKPFKGTTAARVRFLDTAEQNALLQATSGALRRLVAAALMTGARFGELARLRVSDFDPTNGSIFIAKSKSGKPRHVPLTAGGIALFKSLAVDRASNEHLLTRENGKAWKAREYSDEYRSAVASAGLEKMTFHELRHSYASTMVRAGAGLIIVAEALGHSDVRMVTKHYAHLAPSFVAETVRRTAPDLTAAW